VIRLNGAIAAKNSNHEARVQSWLFFGSSIEASVGFLKAWIPPSVFHRLVCGAVYQLLHAF